MQVVFLFCDMIGVLSFFFIFFVSSSIDGLGAVVGFHGVAVRGDGAIVVGLVGQDADGGEVTHDEKGEVVLALLP